jgi:hypothetical protein
MEIDSDNSTAAKAKCLEIKEERQKQEEYIKSKNIFISKTIEKCELCKIDWREELAKCVQIIMVNSD